MLKKLKSLFIIQDESGLPQKASKDVTPVKSAKREVSKPDQNESFVSSSAPTGTPGKASDKFLNVLLGAMTKADLEGFDYLEFKQFLRSLDKVPMDEETKFKSAYATAQTMGATVDVLKKSAEHYINVLDTEEKKFAQAVKNQRENNLTSKQNEIQNLTTIVANKKKQIESMQKDIEKHALAIENRKKEIASASKKVEVTEKNFLASHKLLVEQIQVDVQKINSYLVKGNSPEKS